MKPKKLKRVVIKEELVALTGNYILALILNQFLYWSERTEDVDKFLEEEQLRNPEMDVEPLHGWVFKKANELIDELMLDISQTTLRRYITSLIEKNLLKERHNPNKKWDRTMQYRPDLIEIQKQLHDLGYALEGYPLYRPQGANLQNEECNPHFEGCNPQNKGCNLQNEAAIPEITPEITSETTPDIFPPTPRRGEEKEWAALIEAELVEEEVVQIPNRDELEPCSTSQPKQTATPEIKSVGRMFQTSDSTNNATRRYDDRMRNAGKLRNYRTGYEPDDINQEFLSWFCVRVMSDWEFYKNRTPQEEDAKQWVRNREFRGQYDVVEDRYKQMLREKAEPQKAELLRTQNIFRSVNKESERRRKVETGLDVLDGLE